ncbi:NAC domain-containing protein 40 isoform X1 [Beta vulgaris subsp. vulgaris]|uniref:NAC domain-containing protein 40 isoform X1 n=1 Tax=Beta vulgaris subsp. vulgaris TaxID=3555 RepID=UPI002036E537|nr:NAC domain-containing protein 40 isoform X1 [Beta vulgaris subsp. vulgaris]XP_048495748.1 NAC domain-containing protein 40 isoform X1 [Beta vulgaris subsp. vulgaris]
MDGNVISKEAESSIAASSMFPGFRFSPTDEELILYYLKKKLEGYDKCVEIIPEVDICKYEPWDLPSKAIIKSDQEWFFFSPRGKKYPNGSQSKRATEIGYWKATGKERAVKSGLNAIGTKRTLVFHIGRAPKGERTEWIMHEYCVSGKGQDALVVCRLRRKNDYHAMNCTNGDFQLSDSLASSGTYLGCGIDPLTSTSREDKMAECSFKKSSSSHDSHSVEQTDSPSQSDWKTKDEIDEARFVSPVNHAANEDDLFAEILNDSIIKLDECLPSTPASTFGAQPSETNTTTVPIVPRTSDPPHHPVTPRASPSQGTANRRIRLRKLRRFSPRKEELEAGAREYMVHSKSKQLLGKGRNGWIMLFKSCFRLYVVVITIVSVTLLLTYATAPNYCY